ncbi:tetratricopeptide repeat protein, partial [bacterium]|nr:tetratricopeptide repeat protein [bacterium]
DIHEQAEILLKNKKYKLVEKLAIKYLVTHPEHYKLRAVLAKALYNDDNIYETIKECIVILNKEEDNFEIRILLARCYKKINQFSKSINELETVLEKDTDNMTTAKELSELYIETNQKVPAIKMLKKLESLTENNLELTEIKTKIADLNIELENYPEAFDELNGILEIYPEDTETHKKLIELYIKVNNNERAIADCEELLAVNENNSLSLWLLNNLINLCYLQKDIDKTMEYAKKLLEHPFSDKIKTKTYIAKILIASGKEEEGLEILNELAESNKENIEIKRLMIETYEEKNKYISAIELYKEILDLVSPLDVKGIHTEMSNLFVKWAKYLFENQEVNECFKIFTLASQYDNENPEIYYELGQVNSFIKNYNEAIIQYKKAIGLNPQTAKYYIAIADAYENLGNTFEQKNALITASNVDENNTDVLYKLALLYNAQHDRTGEIKALEKIIELEPDHIDAKYMLALILESQGNIEEALNFYKEIERINPDYKNVKENIRMLSKEDEFQEP